MVSSVEVGRIAADSSVYAHSVGKCIAELHASMECVNSLQSSTEVSNNPMTDRSEDHCMYGVHDISKFWEVEAMSPTA